MPFDKVGKHMKINENFLLRDVAGNKVVMPIGEAADRIHGMIKLNGTGAFLFEHLLEETDEDALLAAMIKAYDVSEETALADIRRFVATLRQVGILEE